MRVSIITPLFNRLELTLACLESLQRTLRAEDYEWIFVDDGSTDGTREFLRTLPSDGRYRVILNETPRGFAANNNLGANLARAPLLCLLNNDTVLLPGWLEPMARLAELLPDVACVGNVQREPISGLIDHAGVRFHHDGYPRHVAKDESVAPREDYLEWPAVTAACCVIRRQVFHELGGFDEAFRNGSEDVDFCLRAGVRGYRHFVANRSVIYHHISSSPGRTRHEKENQRLFRERWLARLQTELGARRSRRQAQERGRGYLRKHRWQPWRYNGWRFLHALEAILSPRPPTRSLDIVPRLIFQAQDFIRQRSLRETGEPTVAANPEKPVFMLVGNTARTADRSGIPTTVRSLAGAFGRMDAPVRPVMWDDATRAVYLLPPELSIGLDADALRPPTREDSAPAFCAPTAGDLYRPYTDTPALHGFPPEQSLPDGSWVFLPEVLPGEQITLLLDYVGRHRWKLAVIVYDLMPNHEPQFFPFGAANEHEVYLRAVSAADLILPVSEFVAADWERFVNAKELPKAQCKVCLPGADLCAQPRTEGSPRRAPDAPVRVLCVSAVAPRKNVRVLLAALEWIFDVRSDLKIEVCIVGMPQLFNENNVPEAMNRFVERYPDKVRWIQRVEYGALCKLYEECDFTVYPSLLEGRGFPIAESLWFGRPCICADTGAMAETAAGGGCLTVDVYHPQAIAEAMISLAESPERLATLRAEIALRPLKTWEQYALELLAGLPEPAVERAAGPSLDHARD